MNKNIREMLRRQALDAKRGNANPTPSNLSTFQVELTVLAGQKLSVELFSAYQDALSELPNQITFPLASDYRFACQYFTSNPSMLRAVKFQSSEASTAAPFLASLKLFQITKTPFDFEADNGTPVLIYKTANQLSQNIIDSAYNAALTGYDFLRLTSGLVAAADITLTLVLGIDQRIELRDSLAPADGFAMWGEGGAVDDVGRRPQMGRPVAERTK